MNLDGGDVPKDANELASELAAVAQRDWPDRARGARPVDESEFPVIKRADDEMCYGRKCFYLFGIDDYSTDPRSRRQVEILRRRLGEVKFTEVGFGLDEGGSAWAMIVKSSTRLRRLPVLNDLVWSAWTEAGEMGGDEVITNPA